MNNRPKFTKEQENWLCDVIGDWYLLWKHQLVDYKDKTHRLGYAKEQLKALLCEDLEFFKEVDFTSKEFDDETLASKRSVAENTGIE